MEELLILDPFNELFVVWYFVIEFAHRAYSQSGASQAAKGKLSTEEAARTRVSGLLYVASV